MRRIIQISLLVVFILGLGVAGYFYLPRIIGDQIYPLSYEEYIKECSAKFDLDPSLLAAIIYRESRFRPNAVSPAGAVGLAQVLPSTGYGVVKRVFPEFGEKPDLFDPKINVCLGAAHIAGLLGRYDGNLSLAVAAYNGGASVGDRLERNPNAVIPRETSRYIPNVLDTYEIYKDLYGDVLAGKASTPKTLEPVAEPVSFWKRVITDAVEGFFRK